MRGQHRLTLAKLREAWTSSNAIERTIKQARELIERGNTAKALSILSQAETKAGKSKLAIEEAARLLRSPDASR